MRMKVTKNKLKTYLLYLKSDKLERLVFLRDLKKKKHFFKEFKKLFSYLTTSQTLNKKFDEVLPSVSGHAVKLITKETKNNFFATATDIKGNVLCRESGGAFKRREAADPSERSRKKNTIKAQNYALDNLAVKLNKFKVELLYVMVENKAEQREISQNVSSKLLLNELRYSRKILNHINKPRLWREKVKNVKIMVYGAKAHNGIRKKKKRRK